MILSIVEPMRVKADEEKEAIAEKALKKAVIRGWRFDEQEQHRTSALIDREVLAMATDELVGAHLLHFALKGE